MRQFVGGGLAGNKDFLRLWAGQTVSLFGGAVSDLAIPTVAILVLGGGPAQLGLLGAAQFLPFLLLSLPAGGIADRTSRRRLMIAADVGRCLALTSIPIAGALHLLSFPQLYFVAFVTGTFQVLFDTAYQASLRSLVSTELLVEGNSKLQLSFSAATLIGPGLAGFLVQLAGAALAVGIDALSYLVSAVSILSIRSPEPTLKPLAPAHLLRDIAEGVRFVLSQRPLALNQRLQRNPQLWRHDG